MSSGKQIRPITDAFEQACRALKPLLPGARLLLACSAGGDSMSLLDLAVRAAPNRRWALAVVHVDHRQRPESAAEAQFVLEQAASHAIPLFSERLPDRLILSSPLSEEVMRQARHEAYRRFARIWQADAVVLAHQADDRAETFLIRLLAGSGPTGLASIRAVEPLGDMTLVRPLLALRRAELRQYLAARGLPWREDPGNLDSTTKRGWVRGTLLPLFRQRLALDPTERIARAAELIEDEAAVLAEASTLILRAIALAPPPPALARLDLRHPFWRGASPLLRRQLLRHWLWQLRQGPHPPGYEAVSETLAFAVRAHAGAELRTIERIHIVKLRGGLLAFPPKIEAAQRAATVRELMNGTADQHE